MMKSVDTTQSKSTVYCPFCFKCFVPNQPENPFTKKPTKTIYFIYCHFCGHLIDLTSCPFTFGSKPFTSSFCKPSPFAANPFTPSSASPSPFATSPFTWNTFTPSPFASKPFSPSSVKTSPLTWNTFTPSSVESGPFATSPFTSSSCKPSSVATSPFASKPFASSSVAIPRTKPQKTLSELREERKNNNRMLRECQKKRIELKKEIAKRELEEFKKKDEEETFEEIENGVQHDLDQFVIRRFSPMENFKELYNMIIRLQCHKWCRNGTGTTTWKHLNIMEVGILPNVDILLTRVCSKMMEVINFQPRFFTESMFDLYQFTIQENTEYYRYVFKYQHFF